MARKHTTSTKLDSRSSILDPQSSILNAQPRAFTLIELMISIALVLFLILGVNQVFTYTTQAVGAGEAVNAGIRASRAAQATFAGDFSAIVPNGGNANDAASIIISSRAYYSYRDAKDQAAEGTISSNAPTGFPTDNSAFLDLNTDGLFGDKNVNGEVVYPCTYNFRNHRLDVLSFFARGQFHRQTGNPGVMVDDMSSPEAWIWYGHLNLPDNSGVIPSTSITSATASTTFPCMGSSATNPNNYFGSKLVLGRMGVLLKTADSFSNIYDNAGNPQSYVGTGASSLDPLWIGAKATPSSDGSYNFPASRFDLANTSISKYRTVISAAAASWWDAMLDGNAATSINVGGYYNYTRFICNPFISKPMTSQGMAQASPYFLGGCSQFIVEYAGDFLTQDNNAAHTDRTTHSQYGDVTAPGPDGQLDWVLVNGQKQIQWYGMPRSTSGKATVSWLNGDVVPLRDRFQVMYGATTGLPLASQYSTLPIPALSVATLAAQGYPTFEKCGPAYKTDYSNVGGSPMTPTEANTGYTCAFACPYSSGGQTVNDPAPKLIRITMTLEDPTGRLPEGQTYQYVFAVPQQ